MLTKVFKSYDVRATYPKPLNEKLAWQIGWGTAEFLLGEAAAAGRDEPMMRVIAVGRDIRKSSPSLAEALTQGMRDFGADVVDLGLVDTPFTYFAANRLGCAGAVMVTASHNPPAYNGFKISRAGARPVGGANGLGEIQRLAALVERDRVDARGGAIESRDLWTAYREHLLRFLEPAILSGKRTLKIAVDASNGSAGAAVPKVLHGIPGLKLEEIHFEHASGTFAHEPNPLVEANLADVKAATLRTRADFGVCFDGDADRCILVDETGATVGCDLLLAAMVAEFLEGRAGASIVYDLRSSRAVPEAIRAAGGVPVESRVGHVFMKAKLAETKAPLGGELSGHFYFEDMFGTDSGLRTLVAVASLVARSGKPLSRLVAPFRRYAHSGEINFENEDKEGALAALRKAYPRAKVTTLDGVSLDAGGWWCNVRMSNTEPLLRLNLESADTATTERMVKEVSRFLGKRVDH